MLDDIEDIGSDVTEDNRHLRKLPLRVASAQRSGWKDIHEAVTDVPGTQRIWVKTFGCSHNISDSEYMSGLLSAFGYR
jgi:threonylcarbamoyladenosine tRNA methylthiotransferase CDKAL1